MIGAAVRTSEFSRRKRLSPAQKQLAIQAGPKLLQLVSLSDLFNKPVWQGRVNVLIDRTKT